MDFDEEVIRKLKNDLNTILGSVQTVNDSLVALPKITDIESIKKEMSELKKTIDLLETIKGYFNEDGFFSKAGKVTRSLSELGDGLDKILNSKLSSLENDISSIERKVDGLKDQLNRLEQRTETFVTKSELKDEIKTSSENMARKVIEEYENKIKNNLRSLNDKQKKKFYDDWFK